MTISMYSASVPVLRQMLTALKDVLAKGEAFAQERKIEPAVLLGMRLSPDMFPLTRQVQIAADFAKGCALRLAGQEVPSIADTEQSFGELYARIDATLQLIESVTPEQMQGSEGREIVLRPGTPREQKLDGHVYLTGYALPQFFFHVTTAYAILRHAGVPVGKKDYMGRY